MRVCTTLSLHQPSAHPVLSLPCCPASAFTVNRAIMVRGIALLPFHVVLGMPVEQGRGKKANEGKARILCRRDAGAGGGCHCQAVSAGR